MKNYVRRLTEDIVGNTIALLLNLPTNEIRHHSLTEFCLDGHRPVVPAYLALICQLERWKGM